MIRISFAGTMAERIAREWQEEEQRDRWTLTFTGVCPRCKGKEFIRTDDHLTGEIEVYPCDFCLSREEYARRVTD